LVRSIGESSSLLGANGSEIVGLPIRFIACVTRSTYLRLEPPLLRYVWPEVSLDLERASARSCQR
jgi:hypothetical protein